MASPIPLVAVIPDAAHGVAAVIVHGGIYGPCGQQIRDVAERP